MFLALDIPIQQKNAIATWRAQNLLVPYRQIPAENFHITLLFLGSITNTDIKQLINLLDKYYQISNDSLQPSTKFHQNLMLNRIGIFQAAKVLHLFPATTAPWLTTLHQQLSHQVKALALNIESRPYQPHISLFRKAKVDDFTANLPISPTSIFPLKIDSFSLYHSHSTPHGVQYNSVRRWKI